jgi:hypothetical protein
LNERTNKQTNKQTTGHFKDSSFDTPPELEEAEEEEGGHH